MPSETAFAESTSVAEDATVQRIVVAVDFSPASLRALAYARLLAESFGATVTLVHAARDPVAAVLDGEAEDAARAERATARGRLDELARELGSGARADVEDGDPAGVILEKAVDVDADLVVMGTHGRTGLERVVLGSVAARVLRHSPCPVLTVPVRPSGESL